MMRRAVSDFRQPQPLDRIRYHYHKKKKELMMDQTIWLSATPRVANVKFLLRHTKILRWCHPAPALLLQKEDPKWTENLNSFDLY